MKLQNLIHILIGIACTGLLPQAQAVSPAPDGGYPGGNTAEGQDALLSLTTATNNTGNFNTANGASALFSNTTGSNNTAVGRIALFSTTTGTDNTALGVDALFSNTTVNSNTAIGRAALSSNT